jgi:hypothetical protein
MRSPRLLQTPTTTRKRRQIAERKESVSADHARPALARVPWLPRLTVLLLYVLLGATGASSLTGCGGGGGITLADGGTGGTGGGGAGSGSGGTGGGSGGGGVGGTGFFAMGAVAAVSADQLVVGGSQFAATGQTKVRIDDDDAATAAALRPGMVVDVVAFRQDGNTVIEAKTIEYRSNVRGPVEQVAADCKSMTVLSQRVRANSATQGLSAGGLCDLTIGQAVDVSGLVVDNETNEMIATLVRPSIGLVFNQVIGQIAEYEIDKKSILIGALNIDVAGAQVSPVGTAIRKGASVLVQGNITGQHRLSATSIEVLAAGAVGGAGTEAELQGYVSGVSGQEFLVGTQRVDYSRASIEPRGTIPANGMRVEVHGTLNSSGTLVAHEVHLEQ